MRIAVDASKCCGAGQCVLTAPNVFDHSDEGVAFPITPCPAESERAAIQEAIELCPTGAISIID
jgi:ferredoxin